MDPARLTTRTTRSPRPETTTEPQAQAQQYRALTEPQPELPASPTTTQPISTPIRPTPRYGLDHLHLSDREDPPQPVSGSPETQSTGPVSFQASSVLATRRLLPTEPGTGAYPAAMGPTRHLDDHDPALGYRVASPMAGSPPRGRDSMLGHQRGLSRRATVGGQSQHFVPGMDGSVPVAEKAFRQKTVGERLQPTVDAAQKEKAKYAKKATMTGYALNAAIGAQVLLGALTTAIGAAMGGKNISTAVSALGGMSTMVASFLARTQGSHEPELSITRVKDLEHFLRDCHSFQMDHGHMIGTVENGLNRELDELRRRFEELLGNANGERKLSPV